MNIPDEGKLELLASQFAYLAACKWGLFTTNYTVLVGTVLADLLAIEAAWPGYARVTVGSLNPASIVGARAVTTPVVQPTFANGSGGSVSYYGWFLMNSAATKLVAAKNVGLQTILAGGVGALIQNITDKEE